MILDSKKYYPKFWVPTNSGLGSDIPDIPGLSETQKITHNFGHHLQIISAAIYPIYPG
jgi:hypothetical protein